MGKELTSQEKKVIEQYSGFPEGKRLSYTKAHETEFIITMHYIHEFLKDGAVIADIGAGGGTYTKALAEEGYKVDAVEYIIKHPKIFCNYNCSELKLIYDNADKEMHLDENNENNNVNDNNDEDNVDHDE